MKGVTHMDVLMPQVGETVAEGTISAWLKRTGDQVAPGEALLEIETDKTTMEVPAPGPGVLAAIRVPAGQTVKVGTVLAVIETAGAPSALAFGSLPTPVSDLDPDLGFDIFDAVRTPTESYGPARAANGVPVTPRARRLAAQRGADLDQVAAQVRHRPGGIVRGADVLGVLAAQAPAAVGGLERAEPVGMTEPAAGETALVLNRIRLVSARHLAQAWRSAPHVLQAVEIDFEPIVEVRQAHKDAFKAQHGVALTYLPFIARAVCLALGSFPQINARLDGERLVLSRDVHLGIAVDLSHEGLVVPVIRHADLMTVTGLAKAVDGLVRKARAGRLSAAEVEGGTYTISNNGSFGTLFTAPIINVPQVAILSTDSIAKRAVVKTTDVGDVIVARHVGILAQSFDHRAFDGAYSAAYLARLRDIIETRDWAGEIG